MQKWKSRKWKSLLPNFVIDDIVFTPLDDACSLAAEGYEMHHCVGQYGVQLKVE
ncbi:MAG: PcfJ domain-containing protein, partial [Zoogloeaceae bacterium]|nr:PcfJ domain-containing protein [Zoogloeaceae bacterium]